jgi:hypothetical protein
MSEAWWFGADVIMGAIALPWCVWVTAQIYALRQSAALQEQRADLVRQNLDERWDRIESHLSRVANPR